MLRRDPHCKLCRLSQTAEYVCLLGMGPQRCEVMVVGEAPGKREDDSGKPFVGKSGALLEELLERHGFAREDVFITNAVSCRPPDNRTPTKGEIKACKKWLDYQIAMVQPKYILLLGNVPLQSITGKAGITRQRGRPFVKEGITYLPTFHPSFALREPSNEVFIDRDIKLFREIVDFGGIPENEMLSIRLVMTDSDVIELIEDLTGTVSVDLETSCLYPWQTHVEKGDKLVPDPARIITFGFGTKNYQWILPTTNHSASPWSKSQVQDIVEQAIERLEDCFVVMQNGKFDALWMLVHHGVKCQIDFDTMMAHYMLDENGRHGLKLLAQQYLGAPDWEIDLVEKQGNTPLSRLAKYQAHDLYYTRELRYVFGRLLNKDPEVKQVFKKIIMPCVELFIEVEYDGLYIDETKFESAEKYLKGQYDGALKRLKQWEPKGLTNAKGKPIEFNWGSPQQLGDLLFNRLKLPVIERTPTGNPSCNESVIKRIDHPLTDDLLKFRAAKQQLSFFIDGWKPFIHRKPNGDVYLHPSFKLHGTVTGRLSSEHPNAQQIPRDPRIRSLITAPKGWTLLEFDLSQIELRIAAELANEQNMLQAFRDGIDVHWMTALREISRGGGLKELVIGTAKAISTSYAMKYSEAIEILTKAGADAAAEVDAEWKELRKKAKAVNFGYVFGMWWKKFKEYARDNYGITVTDEQAQASREIFFTMWPGFEPWHKRQRRYARKHGYVKSLSGRKRRLPEARSAEDTPERREAERQAINSPVQSFANELNLMAALQLRREYPRGIVKVCATVHDSVLVRVKNTHVAEVYNRMLQIMRRPKLMDEMDIDLSVPIEAEGKIGPWGAGTSLRKWIDTDIPF